MVIICAIFLLGLLSISTAVPSSGLSLLFPEEQRQYTYVIKTNISCGTLVPAESDSYWTLEGKLLIQVYDNFTKVRYNIGNVKTSIFSRGHGYVSYQAVDAAKHLKDPWEVEYQGDPNIDEAPLAYSEDGNIEFLYVTPSEPVWATNMKRALSMNFQLKRDIGTYYNHEPCLYESYMDCQVVYVANGNQIRKYNALHILSKNSGYSSWMSVPKDLTKAAFFTGAGSQFSTPGEYSGPLDNIGTADRIYELDDKIGLTSLDLTSVFQHKTRSHVLAVTTELSLNYDSDAPLERIDKIDVVKTSKRYESHDYNNPTNGIRNYTQTELGNTTYSILLRIASKGIDADNIVRNASKIHNLDFVNLLKTMSQLDYSTLSKLFEDMVLGTSYEVETARNIFLEILPHVRTNACARFIKHLVIEQKSKLEDATILSLVRKLPFNVANHSQELLEELEVFTRLGLDFPQDIRHAAILSFATLVFRAAEVHRVKQDYFDNIVVKYFRMYSDCPQYIDRLVWLQGLSNIQYATETYMWTIYNDSTFSRHERFWAVLASTAVFAPTGFAPTWHILMNENDHIQVRLAALHSFLSSKIRPSDLLSIHNYIMGSDDDQLKRFWFSTIKSLEYSKKYNTYRVASNYIPFLTSQVKNPDSKYWATGNQILGTYDDETSTGAMLQLLTIGDPLSGFPALIHCRIKTVSELMATSDIGVYIKAEGVAANVFKKLHTLNSEELNVEKLVDVLRKMKVQIISPQEVHIEIVVKVHEKTVYATHFNQSRFDSWNGEDLTKSIEDFLRFGSHINQQMVYYPFQLDANIPTELGTPVRLQTAVVSFSSLRGNLTAPSTNELTWRNDFHIRYQGSAVTALSTDGPLLQSEHTARVQQSVVAHMPMKFDVTFSPVTSSFELKWPNPSAQKAGFAMHARAEIEMESVKGKDTHTVSLGDQKMYPVDESSVFFDCDRPMSSTEVLGKIFTPHAESYDYLSNVQPTYIFLNSLLLLSAPPSGSCGLVIGGDRNGSDSELTVAVQMEELSFAPDDRLQMLMAHNVLYGESRPNDEVFFNVTGFFKLEGTDGNISLDIELAGEEPKARDPARRKWKFYLQEQDTSHGPSDRDITCHPAAYEGHLTLNYSTGEGPQTEGSQFQFDYKGLPSMSGKGTERSFEFTMQGSKLPKLNVLTENGFITYPPLGQLLSNLEKEPLNVSAIIKEKNGLASISINYGPEMRFMSENLGWLLDSWSNMQIMKKFGIYRECRLQESTVQTLSGSVQRLPPVLCLESLALADCTDSPRFAVLRTRSGGIKLYTGGNHVAVSGSAGVYQVSINDETVDCRSSCVYPPHQPIYDFKITLFSDTVKIHSRLSGVQVYYKTEETVILAPHSYMSTGCGACMGQNYYKLC